MLSQSKKKLCKIVDQELSACVPATDMVVHFKMLSEEKEMAETGFESKNERHRELLRSLIISCADISDQTKDWTMCRNVAVSLRHVNLNDVFYCSKVKTITTQLSLYCTTEEASVKKLG